MEPACDQKRKFIDKSSIGFLKEKERKEINAGSKTRKKAFYLPFPLS